MRKQTKTGILSIVFCMLLLVEFIFPLDVYAEERTEETVIQTSGDLSDFKNTLLDRTIYGSSLNSYLSKTNRGYQAVLVDGRVHILDFDQNWNQLSERILDYELPIFGGYYSGENYNYLVFGQSGSSEGTEIYRIVKYDKNFNRVAALSILYEDCYAKVPFNSGNVSIAESGQHMTVYTSRKQPNEHQSNIALRINTETMMIENNFGMVSVPDIHVSHSFRQIVKYAGDKPIYVDLGDAYPRAVCLQEESGKKTIMLDVEGQDGDNVTDTDVSGLEITDTGYLVVGTQVHNNCNNIYLSYAEKGTETQTARVLWLTNSTPYQYSSVCNAKIIKVRDGVFAVMWNCYDSGSNVNYVLVNDQGEPVSGLKTLSDAELTQCEPILDNGKVTWFKYSNGKREVYSLTDFSCTGSYELKDPYVSAVNPWDGGVDTSWYQENRESFILTRPQQLAGLAQIVNAGNTFEGKKVLLGNDMFFNSDNSFNNIWTPIANESSGVVFQGTFDGQGYSLYNLCTCKANGFGLFGVVGEKGIIKAVKVSQSVMEMTSVVYKNNGWILFCENNSMIYNDGQIDYTAGICCRNANLVYGCGNAGSVIGRNAGGIVGTNVEKTASIDSCWNQGYVNGTGFATAGIVSDNYGYVYDCYNAGTVSGNDWYNYSKTVAGIVGGNHEGSIKNCYNKGHLDVNDEWNWFLSDAICGEGSEDCTNVYSLPSEYNHYATEISVGELSSSDAITMFQKAGIVRWCTDKDNLNNGSLIPIAQQDMKDGIHKMLPDVWEPITEVSIKLIDKDYQLRAFSYAYYGIKDAKAVYSSDSDILSISPEGKITPLKPGTALVKVTFEETEHTKEANYDVTVTILEASEDEEGEDIPKENPKPTDPTPIDPSPENSEEIKPVTPEDTKPTVPEDTKPVLPEKHEPVVPEETKPVIPENGWYTAEDGAKYYYKDSKRLNSQWFEEQGNWYYLDEKGAAVTGWQSVDGAWYYLDKDAKMTTGWQEIDDSWYYLGTSGAMQTGWQDIGGKSYYFYGNGSMAENAWVDGYYLGTSGAWVVNPVQEGWKQFGNKWWYQYPDKTYPKKTWKKIGGTWYYFEAAGWMSTGWTFDGKDWYYLNADGTMKTGWLLDGNTWYYLKPSGAMATGWVCDSGNWYLMNASGAMMTGWAQQGDDWYYLNESGVIQTGWLNLNGTWYYLDESGAMAHDTIIDGCVLGSDGAWIQGFDLLFSISKKVLNLS